MRRGSQVERHGDGRHASDSRQIGDVSGRVVRRGDTIAKSWVCPKCKERVGLREFYAKGHAKGDCPMTTAQKKQLGMEEE